MKLNYQPINPDHQPIIGNFYLYQTEEKLCALFLIARLKDKFYFLNFKTVEFTSQDFKSYLTEDLQTKTNHDANWYWTKSLLNNLDSLATKPMKIKTLSNFASIVDEDQLKMNFLYEVKKEMISQLGFCYEMEKDDLLEAVAKILFVDQTDPFLPLNLKEDFVDTQGWLLDTLFDNG